MLFVFICGVNMLKPEEIHQLSQNLIDSLEKEIEAIQRRIEGVALLYKHLAENDGRQEQKERADIPSGKAEAKEKAGS